MAHMDRMKSARSIIPCAITVLRSNWRRVRTIRRPFGEAP